MNTRPGIKGTFYLPKIHRVLKTHGLGTSPLYTTLLQWDLPLVSAGLVTMEAFGDSSDGPGEVSPWI